MSWLCDRYVVRFLSIYLFIASPLRCAASKCGMILAPLHETHLFGPLPWNLCQVAKFTFAFYLCVERFAIYSTYFVSPICECWNHACFSERRNRRRLFVHLPPLTCFGLIWSKRIIYPFTPIYYSLVHVSVCVIHSNSLEFIKHAKRLKVYIDWGWLCFGNQAVVFSDKNVTYLIKIYLITFLSRR